MLPAGDKQTTPSGGAGIHIAVKAGVALTNENFVVSVPATSSVAVNAASLEVAGAVLDADAAAEMTDLVTVPLTALIRKPLR